MTEAAVDGLLERGAELQRIDRALDGARAGAGAVVVVEGPPGIGKSSLLREALARAEGFAVARARGGELERDFPWGVVRQLFETRVVLGDDRDALLAAAAAHAAEPLGLAGVGRASAEAEFAALHGLHWLVVNLTARGPLLLVVDDLHWADPASARFVAYLARRVEELPLVLLLGRRPIPATELDPAAEPGTSLIRLGGLSERAVQAVVEEAFGTDAHPGFVQACHRATGGNPFLISELVAELRREGVPPAAEAVARIEHVGPQSVARAVLRRVAGAAAGAEELAAAVAVLGRDADLRHAVELAGLDRATAARAADALAAADVLRPGRPLEFVHPVVRAAVHDALPAAQLAETHGRAARLLASDGAGPGRVAVHLLASEPQADRWAVGILREAAARALSNGAPEAAATFLRRALGEAAAAERTAVLRELGRAESLSGEPGGVDRLRAALDATVDPRERAEIGRELGLALVPGGRYDLAAPALEAAAEDALRAGDSELALRLESEVATAGRLFPQTEPATRRRLEAVPDEGLDATPAGRLLLCSKALWAVLHRTAPEAVAFARRGLARGMPADPTVTNCLWDVVYALTVTDEAAAAEAWLDEIARAARERGSILSFARAACFRAILAMHTGRVTDAEAEARICLETAGRRAWVVRRMATGVLAAALAEEGRADEAVAAVEAVAPADLEEIYMLALVLEGRAHARAAAGDLAGAAADLEELGRREAHSPGATPRLPWRAQLAEVELRRGHRERAAALAAAELERSRAWGAPAGVGAALRVAALAVDDDPRPRLAESVALLERSPRRLEHARALVDLGAAVRRAGQPAEAREHLRRGLELADRAGAGRLAVRAREELLAAGARPRRTALSGVESLTPSERRVATMAAGGMTNREIAQALFVTLRTVEVHLTHAYGKLGVTSRGELPAALTT